MKLKVEGMSCGGCVSSVRRILTKSLALDEESVTVDLEAGQATLPDDVDPGALEDAMGKLQNAGFPTARARG
jgi:copper chaperone CopZ